MTNLWSDYVFSYRFFDLYITSGGSSDSLGSRISSIFWSSSMVYEPSFWIPIYNSVLYICLSVTFKDSTEFAASDIGYGDVVLLWILYVKVLESYCDIFLIGRFLDILNYFFKFSCLSWNTLFGNNIVFANFSTFSIFSIF